MAVFSCPEIVSIIRDLVVSIAAIITAIVAIRGINKWRHETKGRAEFEIARSLITATYKLRDEIGHCRSPMIWAYEFPKDYSPDSNDYAKEASALAFVYQKRLGPVFEAVQLFDTYALEGEALWGEICSSATEELRGCVSKLNSAIQDKIDNKARGGDHFKSDTEYATEIKYVVSTWGKNNPFTQEIKDAIARIEGVVLGKLRGDG